jgi:hypothetical protein
VCRCLCRNPAIPAGISRCSAVSLGIRFANRNNRMEPAWTLSIGVIRASSISLRLLSVLEFTTRRSAVRSRLAPPTNQQFGTCRVDWTARFVSQPFDLRSESLGTPFGSWSMRWNSRGNTVFTIIRPMHLASPRKTMLTGVKQPNPRVAVDHRFPRPTDRLMQLDKSHPHKLNRPELYLYK